MIFKYPFRVHFINEFLEDVVGREICLILDGYLEQPVFYKGKGLAIYYIYCYVGSICI